MKSELVWNNTIFGLSAVKVWTLYCIVFLCSKVLVKLKCQYITGPINIYFKSIWNGNNDRKTMDGMGFGKTKATYIPNKGQHAGWWVSVNRFKCDLPRSLNGNAKVLPDNILTPVLLRRWVTLSPPSQAFPPRRNFLRGHICPRANLAFLKIEIKYSSL